ncbi:SpoIID/LytB domain-containing protein [Niallia sp. NCCP-28]|uniref:SpoIID/LytB domain-containing protein n=1 Tax=Niallia sp. NCCP-28 TaxID=2934712 RepID=UPI002081DD77|nr:SpoIID/LytB domain-containing protein [Niallia sp. NCCP-28]GKU81590.1 hypothetical protein NCCP28_09860 [Niallia sp. NCCP-28]
MKKFFFLFLIAITMTSTLITPIYPKANSNPILKVKLVNYIGNTTSITLKTIGEYKLSNGKIINDGMTLAVEVKNDSLQLIENVSRTVLMKSNVLTLEPKQASNTLSLNGRSYYGSFQFVMEKSTANNAVYIRPINEIDIETYLRGVVPQEMPALWPLEALKAQTVAARTYALKHKDDKEFVDTISNQVYGGAYALHSRSDEAIRQTEGMILKYNDKLIDTVFSSSNGGKTELNSSVWGGYALPYFAVQDDIYDYNPTNKTKFPWSIELSQQQLDPGLDLSTGEKWWNSVVEKDASLQVVKNIKDWMQKQGYSKKIEDMKIMNIPVLQLNLSNKTAGGRVLEGSATIVYLKKEIVNNKTVVEKNTLELKNVAASKIRALVGIESMRSYLVDASENKAGFIKINGKGYGHAVGLSQYGARNRAEAGHSYQQILGFYYPKSTLIKAYSGAAASEQKPKTGVQSKSSTETKKTVQDKVAPVITGFKTNPDYKKNKMNLSLKTNKPGKIVIKIKDSKGKTIATLSDNNIVKAGNIAFEWNIAKINNGIYKAEISAANADGIKRNFTNKIAIKKTVPVQNGKVNATILHIREKPTTNSKIKTKLKKKQSVVIVSKHGSWYKIKAGKSTGYVKSKYITKS